MSVQGHHTFKIKAPVDCNGASIEIDGAELKGVTRVAFVLEPGGLMTMKLEIIGEVELDGEFRESAIVNVEQMNPRPPRRASKA